MYRTRKENERPRWVELFGDYKRDLRDGKVGYHFTIRMTTKTPALSHILPDAATPVLTPLGEALKSTFYDTFLSRAEERYWIDSLVIMPDHIHLLIWVNQPLQQSILRYLVRALLFTTRYLEETFHLPAVWQLPGRLFQYYSWDIVKQKKAYNEANVTRWKMDHYTPDLSHPHPISHPKLDPQYIWEGYGDIRLLDLPHALPCYISHTTTEKELNHFTRLAIKLAQAGWLLVGGFVSPQERALLKAVRDACPPSVLHLCATRLKDEKVPAHLAHALYQGHFLRLTSAEDQATCTRELCVWHNLWAERFCTNWRTNVETFFDLPHLPPTQSANLRNFLNHWKSPQASKYRGPRTLP